MDLMALHQRAGELEAELAQRDAAIRELRRRLHELEQMYWERQSKLEDEFIAAQDRLLELYRAGAERVSAPTTTGPTPAVLQAELDALRATRTFRYTATARAAYGRVRALGRRAPRANT
jgi:hypothetical protein